MQTFESDSDSASSSSTSVKVSSLNDIFEEAFDIPTSVRASSLNDISEEVQTFESEFSLDSGFSTPFKAISTDDKTRPPVKECESNARL